MTWTVEPRPDGKWAVQRDGTKRAESLHSKKHAAVARGKQQVRIDHAPLRPPVAVFRRSLTVSRLAFPTSVPNGPAETNFEAAEVALFLQIR